MKIATRRLYEGALRDGPSLIRCAGIISDAILTQRLGGGCKGPTPHPEAGRATGRKSFGMRPLMVR